MNLKHSLIKIRLFISNNVNSFRIVLVIHLAKVPLSERYKMYTLLRTPVEGFLFLILKVTADHTRLN